MVAVSPLYKKVQDSVLEAFDVLGVSAHDIGRHPLRKLVLSITADCQRIGVYVTTDSFFNFKDKAIVNLSWLSAYQITGPAWAKACLKSRQLLYQQPSTLEASFEKNRRGFAPYLAAMKFGPQEAGLSTSGQKWGLLCLKQPPLFCLPHDTLHSNFSQSLAWQAAYGLDRQIWIQACCDKPSNLYAAPETQHQNYIANRAWQTEYGIDQADWNKALHDKPQFFYQSPKTLRLHFELMLALALSPSFKPLSRETPSGEARLRWAKSNLRLLNLETENFLLRFAFLDLVRPAPSGFVLTQNRCTIQKELLRALDMQPQEIRALDPENLSPDQQALQRHLATKKDAATQFLRLFARKNAKASTPTAPDRRYLPFLITHRSKTSSRPHVPLLHKLVLAGLVK